VERDLAHLGSPDAWPYHVVHWGANYLPVDHIATQDLRRDVTPAVNRLAWGAPIIRAAETDPVRVFTLVKDGITIRATALQIPDNAQPSAGSGGLLGDRHLVVVQPNGSIFESWLSVRESSGSWTCGDYGWWDAETSWIPATQAVPYTNGMQAANVSIAVGAYRPEHFQAGRVDTVISVILGNAQLGTGLTWPATSRDTDYLTRNTGHVNYGARAVPGGTFDPGNYTDLERAVALGLDKYGIIVTDRSAAPVGQTPRNHFAVRMDPRCTLEQEAAVRRVLTDAIPHLRILA
jgi:hypothetical protein